MRVAYVTPCYHRHEVEQAVVVVVNELRGVIKGGLLVFQIRGDARPRLEFKMVLAVAQRKRPRPAALAEIEIAEAVLIYVADGDAGRDFKFVRPEADILGDIAEAAVAHVAPEQQAAALRDEKVNVAPVVEVGRHD